MGVQFPLRAPINPCKVPRVDNSHDCALTTSFPGLRGETRGLVVCDGFTIPEIRGHPPSSVNHGQRKIPAKTCIVTSRSVGESDGPGP